jgi:DNA polymerase III epsilon subunit-like protein
MGALGVAMDNLVFLDLETTGLNPQGDKIIEIAAVVWGEDGKREVFHSLVNPGFPIPLYIKRLTGIDDEMVAEAPRFAELEDQLAKIMSGKVAVAHNAVFDLSFLKASCGFPLPLHYIDTIEFCKLLYPKFSWPPGDFSVFSVDYR